LRGFALTHYKLSVQPKINAAIFQLDTYLASEYNEPNK